MSSNQKTSARARTAEARAPQRRGVHGGSAGRPLMAFDVGAVSASPAEREPRAPGTRTWRSTVVGAAIGLGIVLAFAMKWLMGYQIDTAQERREQQKAQRAAAARCHDRASNAAVEACLKELAAKVAAAP